MKKSKYDWNLKDKSKLVLKRGSLAQDVQYQQLDSQQSNIKKYSQCYYLLAHQMLIIDPNQRTLKAMILIFFNYLVPDIFYYTGKGLQKKRNKNLKINHHPSKNLEKLKMEMTELNKIMNKNVKQQFIEMKNYKT